MENDKPSVFPIGWYDYAVPANYNSPAFLATMHCDIVLPYCRGSQPITDLTGYLDAVRDSGLYALVELAPLNKTPSLVDGQFNSEELKKFVSILNDRPEIWGWYLYDEPPGPDQLGWVQAKAAYEIVYNIDGRRPVAVAVADVTDIPLDYAFLYRSAADIMMFDYYPLHHEGFKDLDYFYRLWQHAVLAVGCMPYWPILETAGSLSQFRYMVYAAVQSGASGLFFYRYDSIKTDRVWLDNIYMPTIKEFLNYASAFSHPPLRDRLYMRIGGEPQVVGTVYERQLGELLLLLVHHGPGTVRPTLAFYPPLMTKGLKDLSNGAILPVQNNTADIELGDYEIKVLQLERG
jgi:hypothetical protein